MTCVFAGNFAEVGCFRGKKAAAGPIGNDNKKAHATADSSAALRNDNKKQATGAERLQQIPLGDDTRNAHARTTADSSAALRNDNKKQATEAE